ncbi:hypothetical protein J5N97_025920 [Dioscorea zingiberensis]|uniref:Uncharacterized protein n=1 Tax=Dioscorea zingiberensis TaxID=325984 RepID=A0A9D5C290_9LILI|nr:hypothetical protein J5N97_025920 [Dioscorea zingiberensis]
MTRYPYLKKSPPNTCPLLNPVSSREDDKSKNEGPHTSDGPPSEEFIENMASKYQELFGLQTNYNHAGRRKEVDERLDWFLSPPKTCVLMEPSDEKKIPTPANVVVLATPIWNGFEGTIREGNKVGENTLKRELWTKFEAATSSELQFNDPTFQNTAKKGFLDMLEEALQLVEKEMTTLKDVKELGNSAQKAIQKDVSDGANEDVHYSIHEKPVLDPIPTV